MFTLVGYTENQDTGGVLTYVAAMPDPHVRVEGDNIIVPEGMANLGGVLVLGGTLSNARIESPALRRTVLLDVPHLNGGTEPQVPTPFNDFFYAPIPLDPFEPLRALVAEAAAGAEQDTVLVWLCDGPQAPVTGEIFTVQATSNTTLVPNAWTNGALTFVQTLPAGRYAVVGMHAISTGLVAARLVFVGGTWRPGCIGYDARYDMPNPVFRRGGLGVWGEFPHDQPPTVDFLSVSADTSENIWLDLIKVA